MLDDTQTFIENLNLPNLTVVGMSMGGINAIRYTARFGENLRALGIVDVAPGSMAEGQQEMADYREATDVLDNFEDFVDRSKRFMPHRDEAHLRYSLFHSLKQTTDNRYTWKRDRRPRPASTDNTHRDREAEVWQDVQQIDIPPSDNPVDFAAALDQFLTDVMES